MTRDEKQDECINLLAKDIITYGKACLHAFTGFGKTRTILKLIKRAREKNPDVTFQVVVPSDDLRNQWRERTDVPVDTWHSLYNSEPREVDFLVVDEIHSLILTEQYSNIFNVFKTAKVIGVTATLDDKHREGLQRFGIPVSVVVSREEGEANNWMNCRQEYNIGTYLDVKTSRQLHQIELKLREHKIYLNHHDKNYENPSYGDWTREISFKRLKSLSEKTFIGFQAINGGIFYASLADKKKILDTYSDKIKFYKSGAKKGKPYEVYGNSTEMDKLIEVRGVNSEGEIRRRLSLCYQLQAMRTKIINNNVQRLKVLEKLMKLHPNDSIINFTMSKAYADMITEKLGGVSHHSGISSKKRREIVEDFNSGVIRMLNSVETAKEGSDFSLARIAIHHGYNSQPYIKQQKDGRVVRIREGLGSSYIYNIYMKFHPSVNNGANTYEVGFLKKLQKNDESITWILESEI